ncbi:unnamed protein product [Litomosoides sigmodontis]|uniref:Dynein heavy chain tail domain-containing protein n=1 Tax=Litomosoides sigmodontis TaxID=42156 RepID=A0A3P6TZ85_LITSI|nr:unnamed protein product [Litomosoides sigmodontis]
MDYERNDPRRHYILRVASHIFALNLSENKISNLHPIQDFCDTNTQLLIIAKDERKNTFEITNEMRNVQHSDLTQVIFYKREAVALSADNYKSKISIFKHATEADTKTSENCRLRTILNELEMCIEPKNHSEKQLIHDEINYWRGRRDSVAMQYSHAFQILEMKLGTLANCRMDEIHEVIDAAEECFTQLWSCEQSFPQNRLGKIMETIGLLIINSITNKIEMSDVWNSDKTGTMIDALHTINSLCEQWKFAITTLVEQWMCDIDNPWKGGKPMISTFEILQEHTNKACA